MRIGELAQRVGVSTRSLRYYEAQGLLPARRAANGYREYGDAELRMVREIRALLELGFALEDTRPFVECLRDGHQAGDRCPDSIAVYQRKITELDGCIARLCGVRERVAGQLERAVAARSAEPRCVFTPRTSG